MSSAIYNGRSRFRKSRFKQADDAFLFHSRYLTSIEISHLKQKLK